MSHILNIEEINIYFIYYIPISILIIMLIGKGVLIYGYKWNYWGCFELSVF